MADEPIVDDKAAAAAGASAADLSESTGGDGAPAPKDPPKTKAEADAQKAAGNPDAEAEEKAKADAEAKAKAEAEAAASEDDPEDDPEDKPLDNDVWGTTGDAVGDSVLELIQNSGMTTDEAKSIMFDAVQAGDVTKIDEAALIEKVGKAKATLIMAGTRSFVDTQKAKAETITKEVHTAVGGEANWDTVTTWAKENVAEADLNDYRDMIDAGGAKARFAANELLSAYNANERNTSLEVSGGEIVPDNAPTQSSTATTKAQYVAEMQAANKRGATAAEINEIRAARQRGRAKGI